MARQTADSDVRSCLGMPMRWDAKKMFKNFWNTDDPRVFPPKFFGIGWDVNLHALLRRAGLVGTPAKRSRRSRTK